ncbi:hypothetical protein ScPMuIL_008961 [Solemya velum]
MSDSEQGEKGKCAVCSTFEPQAWRRSMCKNCFHTLPEHSADLIQNSSNKKTVANVPTSKTEAKEKLDSKSPPSPTHNLKKETNTPQEKTKPGLIKKSSVLEDKKAVISTKFPTEPKQAITLAKNKFGVSAQNKPDDKLSKVSLSISPVASRQTTHKVDTKQPDKTPTPTPKADGVKVLSVSGKSKEITIQTSGNKFKYSLPGSKNTGEDKNSNVSTSTKSKFTPPSGTKLDLSKTKNDRFKLPLTNTSRVPEDKKSPCSLSTKDKIIISPRPSPIEGKFNLSVSSQSTPERESYQFSLSPKSEKGSIVDANKKDDDKSVSPAGEGMKIQVTFGKKSSDAVQDKTADRISIPIIGLKKHDSKDDKKIDIKPTEKQVEKPPSPVTPSRTIPVTLSPQVEKDKLKSSIGDKTKVSSTSTVLGVNEKPKTPPSSLALDKSKSNQSISPVSDRNKTPQSPSSSVSRVKHFSRSFATTPTKIETHVSTNSSAARNEAKGEHSSVPIASQPTVAVKTPISTDKSIAATPNKADTEDKVASSSIIDDKKRRNSENEEKKAKSKENEHGDNDISTKSLDTDTDLEKLRTKLKAMEEKCKKLEEENRSASDKEGSRNGDCLQKEKDEFENTIKSLQDQLSSAKAEIVQLQTENENLVRKNETDSESLLEKTKQELKECEALCDDLEDENLMFKHEIQDLKNEMDEMYDSFQDQEASEFRELQKDLDRTTKNCRVLQFKLRKSERRTQAVEGERIQSQEKLKMLQEQFESADARAYIKTLEEEVGVAKQVSVRLHDELDTIEEKKQKAEEEARHLTELLEQSDKKQFRMEMLIDKQHDQINDLKDDLARATGRTEDLKERKDVVRGVVRQSSQEIDMTQLTRDLYDSVERENDLIEQLRFAEEEGKAMRSKISDLEEENENLSVQLKRMSTQVSHSKETSSGETKESDSQAVTEKEVELNVHLNLTEQELSVCRKKVHDLDRDKDELNEEVKRLQQEIEHKNQQLNVIPAPSSPKAYYEDKIKEMTAEADDMRWKIIEKDRELERSYAQMNTIQSRQMKMRKSRSLDSDHLVIDLRKQLENVCHESVLLRDKLSTIECENIKLIEENMKLQLSSDKRPFSIEIRPDGSDFLNEIELKTKVRCLEKEKETLSGRIRRLTDCVSNLNNGRSYTKPKLSQLGKQREASRNIPGGNGGVFPRDTSCDIVQLLDTVEREIGLLRRKMSELEAEKSRISEELEWKKDENYSPKSPDRRENSQDGKENVEELLNKISDLEHVIGKLEEGIKTRDEENVKLQEEVWALQRKSEKMEDEFRKSELELLRDLEMAQGKNDIVVNLLEIVKGRADAAEEELERLGSTGVPIFSTASVDKRSMSVISTLSDLSMGSDEVFVGSPGDKSQVIQKDWENQFRKRLDCLEQLLAEEKQKTLALEKKLSLTDTASTGMSDDVKLQIQRKEFLQTEVIESQKHMSIANDQIRALVDRLNTVEAEHSQLQKYCGELQTKLKEIEDEEEEEKKTPSATIDDTSEELQFSMNFDDRPILKSIEISSTQSKAMDKLKKECEDYRLQVKDLECKVDEINEIWVSKSAASEREKEDLEKRFNHKENEILSIQNKLEKMSAEIKQQGKLLHDQEIMLKEKQNIIIRKEELIAEQEDIIKQREDDMQQLFDQISHRDTSIRDISVTIRTRDERLKEKDDIIQNLNKCIDEKHEEIHNMESEFRETSMSLEEKEERILELEKKITELQEKSKHSELQVENTRLKADIENLLVNMEKLHNDNKTLQTEVEKSKNALSQAMMLWDKDRSSLHADLNMAQEKVRMLEITVEKKDTAIISTLRKETHNLLDQKERQANEIRILRIDHESEKRGLKNEIMNLQDELTQKIRILAQEITSNDKMSSELEKLRGQEEIAFQAQHHQKVIRAEYLAMRVRYETRLESLQKEYMKLLATVDKLQREKDLDKDIIKGVQKGMTQIRDVYSNDLTRWNEEKAMLEQHIKEIEEGREICSQLKQKVEGLKTQLIEQERERADLVNRFTTERRSWDVEKSNMQSHINQLDERVTLSHEKQSRNKDMQYHTEISWDKERNEQKRLLAEAHDVALTLQQQLHARDENYFHERSELINQSKSDKMELDKERREKDILQFELESLKKKLTASQKKTQEISELKEKDQNVWSKEKDDLLHRFAEVRKTHRRDRRKIEDILTGVTRLRELANIVVEFDLSGEVTQPVGDEALMASESDTDPVSDKKEELFDVRHSTDQVVLKYIKEALKQIHFAAEELSHPIEFPDDDKQMLRRSLSSSEIEFLKGEFLLGQSEEEIDIFALAETAVDIPPRFRDGSHFRLQRSITCDASTPVNMDTTFDLPSLSENVKTYVPRPNSPVRKITNFPDPSPGFRIPHIQHTESQVFNPGPTAQRPKSLMKSISVDTKLVTTLTPGNRSISADSSPTGYLAYGTLIPITVPLLQTPDSVPPFLGITRASSDDRISPRTARKRFFEDQLTPDYEKGYQSWPKRKTTDKTVIHHQKQSSLPDPNEIQKAVEEDMTSTKSKPTLKTSHSMDEHTVHSVLQTETVPHPPELPKPVSSKDKRRLFKKSASVDSSMKSCIAQVGIQSLQPGAPSTMTAADILSAVKRKLRPALKKSMAAHETPKSNVEGPHLTQLKPDTSPVVEKELGSSEVVSSHSTPTEPAPKSEISLAYEMSGDLMKGVKNKETLPDEEVSSRGRGHDKNKKKYSRSKSADRYGVAEPVIIKPILMHGGMTQSSNLMSFTETSV